MITPPSSTADITPSWLTDCLIQKGHISHGRVTNIRFRQALKAWSGTLTPLLVTYQHAPPSAPTYLIFKQWHTNWANVAAHELYFYTDIVPYMPQIRTPHCYYAHHVPESACAIYEDFTHTYKVTTFELAPLDRTKQVIDHLAQLHAIWWDSPKLTELEFTHRQGGPLCMSHLPLPNVLQEYNHLIREHAPNFMTKFDYDLSDKWRKAFEWAVENWYPLTLKRVKQQMNLTLIHGDVHWRNTAFHKSTDECLLFDWETFKRGVGVFDVAYFVHDTYWGAHRKQHEMSLLQRYHTALQKNGVKDYSWNNLLADYRLSLVVLLFIHLQWRGLGFEHPKAFIQDALDGFEMWNCSTLLRL